MIRAIWLPLSLSLLSLSVGVLFLSWLPFVSLLSCLGAVVLFLDARGRHRDYLWLCSLNPRVRMKYVSRMMRTACSRQVMISALPQARRAYRQQGYRWFHILPDRALSKDSPFFNRTFWRQLFSGQRIL
jgi:hypothetical protein